MRPYAPDPVRLVVSVLGSDTTLMKKAVKGLSDRFGPADFISEPLDFSNTDYYRDELGEGLGRRMVSFEPPIAPDALPGIKLSTNGMEDETLSDDGKRRLNIDPGYIALEKFVLASCKNFSHRIYLGSGVYGEVTLIYTAKGLTALPWTYPDYKTDEMISILLELRKRHASTLGRGLK